VLTRNQGEKDAPGRLEGRVGSELSNADGDTIDALVVHSKKSPHRFMVFVGRSKMETA
jgi:hypothetical protein